MQITSRSLKFCKSRFFSFILFFTLWIVGACIGISIFSYAQILFSDLIQNAAMQSVSVVGLLFVIFVPFLFSAFAFYYSVPVLVYVLCFFQSIIFSVCTLAVFSFFGRGGWLAQLLLMFSENFTMISLLLLWTHCLIRDFRVTKVFFCCCLLIAVVAGVVDFLIVSPFIKSVFIF